MKKLTLLTLLVFVLSLLLVSAALANGEPAGNCPPSFELHMMHDHGGDEHMHHHIGNDSDQNGDGYLCMKHVGNGVNLWNHVHIDNNLP